MNVIYQEKVPTYVILTAILSLTTVVFLVVFVMQYIGKVEPESWPVQLLIGILFVMNVIVLISFRNLTITMSEERLIFGYGHFKKSVQLEQIESVEKGEFKFWNYLGYGVRFGRDGTIGYVPRGGKGLKLKVKNYKKPYFFITARPDELKSMLEKVK